MTLNKELANFIESIIDKHYHKDDRKRMFCFCYTEVIAALENNPAVNNIYAYARTIVTSIIKEETREQVATEYDKWKEN